MAPVLEEGARSRWVPLPSGQWYPLEANEPLEGGRDVEVAAPIDHTPVFVRAGAVIPMDEARASCSLDVSGRPFTSFEAALPPGATGGFEHELTEEFFRAVANAAKLTLHLRVEAGSNAHHMIEAAFKAFARALRQAVSDDPSERGVPSTKGTLTA